MDSQATENEQRPRELMSDAPVVINIGLPEFFEALSAQGVQVVHLDWQPPAAGDTEMLALLDELL